MIDQTNQFPAAGTPEGLPGDPAALLSQIGSPTALDGSGLAGEVFRGRGIRSVAEMRQFLVQYRSEILLPLELPAVCRAYQHTQRFEVRELIELDNTLSQEPLLKEFTVASQCVGRGQLRLLKPLRDLKLIQRYLHAIEHRQAHGWHTVAYGIVLAVFSLPLRQGLISFANQTLAGFLHSSSCPLMLPQHVSQELLEDLTREMPADTGALLKQHGHPSLQLL